MMLQSSNSFLPIFLHRKGLSGHVRSANKKPAGWYQSTGWSAWVKKPGYRSCQNRLNNDQLNSLRVIPCFSKCSQPIPGLGLSSQLCLQACHEFTFHIISYTLRDRLFHFAESQTKSAPQMQDKNLKFKTTPLKVLLLLPPSIRCFRMEFGRKKEKVGKW